MSVSHVADCPDLGPACFGAEKPTPYNHHVDQVMFETSLDASLGVTPFLAIEARLAFRVADINPTYSELDGTPKQVDDDIHHHDETLVDFLDPWLTARFAATEGDLVAAMRLGLTLPVGRTEPNPYVLGREGQWHEHLQGGTGTLVPIFGLSFGYTIAPVHIGLGGVGFFNSYENSKGYRAPVRVYVSHRVAVDLLEGVLRPYVGLDLGHEAEELWDGQRGLEGSSVRSELYGSTGIAYRFFDPWTVDLGLRGRFATLTDAPSFDVPIIVSLGISTSFDLWSESAAELSAAPNEDTVPHRSDKDGVVTFEK